MSTLQFSGDAIGMRFATRAEVARYRAARFSSRTIADLCCGIGVQAIHFALAGARVLCIDINPERVRAARANAIASGVAERMTFVEGDCLRPEIKAMVKDYEIVYADPARPPMSPERTLQGLVPPVEEVLRVYDGWPYIIDLPPQISQEHVADLGTLEYISLNGAINRLTLYSSTLLPGPGPYAVSLPSGAVLTRSSDNERHRASQGDDDIINMRGGLEVKPGTYINEVDEAVSYAGLLPELMNETGVEVGVLSIGKRRTLLASTIPIEHPFITGRYVVRWKGVTLNDIKLYMKREGFGRAVLRISIEPEMYWHLRRRLETDLGGQKTGYVFRYKEHYILGESV